MRARLLFAIAAITWALGTQYAVRAQIPGEDWTRIAMLGINTQSVALSPRYDQDHAVFAGTVGMGVWYSLDSGQTWTQSASVTGTGTDPTFTTQTIAALLISRDYAVPPSTSAHPTVYALSKNLTGNEGRLYQSADGGQTFSLKMTVPAKGTSLAISPNYPTDGKVFAGFDGLGLFYSYDWGATWSQDPGHLHMSRLLALAISPNFSTDGLLFVGGYHSDYGPFQIWNGVGHWTASRSSGLGIGLSEVVISLTAYTSSRIWAGTGPLSGSTATSGHGMYFTTTQGSGNPGWTAGCDGVVGSVPTVPPVLSLAISRNSSPMLLEGRTDQLFQSTSTPNPGTTCAGTTPLTLIQGLAFEPKWDGSNFCDIFVATDAGLFKKTCAVPLAFAGPRAVDGRAVALARAGHGAFIGSAGAGLFKAQARDIGTSGNRVWTMVEYNNFPNKLTPDIVAICLDPKYDETSTTCGDASTLFVAANFPNSPSDNGVYRSVDWGNTWTKITGGAWPSGTVNLNDLAISPNYTSDFILFAATDRGLFRWGRDAWIDCTNDAVYPVYYKVALPPTYDGSGVGTFDQTIFAASDDTKNGPGLWYSRSSGAPTSWIRIGAYSDGVCPNSPSTISGFAFPHNFGQSTGTTRVFVSNASTSCKSVDTSPSYPWYSWTSVNDGLPSANLGANGIAADPFFDDYAKTRMNLLLATPRGPYYGTFDPGANKVSWGRASYEYPTLSVAYDQDGGSFAMAGVTAPYPAGASVTGGLFSNSAGREYKYAFRGFNTLPDDVFQTIAHVRTPNILFSSSPAMGVFLSENKGLSFRPWNASGACPVRSAYGLGMMQNRWTSGNYDLIWAGASDSGIQYRWTGYNGGTSYDLDSWTWASTNLTTGRFERFTTIGTGPSNPVYAASPTRTVGGQGIWATVDYWNWTNTSSPGSDSPSVRFGYASLVSALPLSSGVLISGQTVTNTTWNYYSIQVPAGTASLVIQMTPTSADPDLYVRFGDIPDISNWDYRPYSAGTTQETVTVPFPTPGTWYIGVRDYLTGTCSYSLVATTSTTPPVAGRPAKPQPAGPVKAEVNALESVPIPKAPSAGTVWGTVSRSGVVRGSGSPSAVTEALSWVYRNGAPPNDLKNLSTQTVLQLKDGTLVAGCLGDAFYSPQPDEGQTTWISSTSNFAGTCSYDFRDLLEVNVNPAIDGDLRTDCLIAAYGTGATTSGGVWLSGDKGHHWMKISSGFDPNSQKLNSLAADAFYPAPPDGTTSYYSSTDGTGVYTRTITLQPYPTVTNLCTTGSVYPACTSATSGGVGGGGTIRIYGTGFSNVCPTGTGADCPDSGPVAIFGVKSDGTDNEAVTTYVSSTEITAIVPPHPAGGVPVTVRNPDTRRSVTSVTYTYGCSSTPPSGLATITAIDLDPYAKTGVQITWNAEPAFWNDGGGTRVYKVLRGATAGTLSPLAGATIAYGAATTYTDTTGTAGMTYYYAVRYTNGCGYSADTTPVTAVDQALVPPEAGATPETALRGASGAKNQLCWGTSAGGARYHIYKGDNSLQPVSKLVAGVTACKAYTGAGVGSPPCSTATLNDAPVTPGNFYWYLLDAFNANGEGPLDSGATYKVSSAGDCPTP